MNKPKTLTVVLLTLNKPKKLLVISLVLNEPKKKLIVVLLRLFYGVETFLLCRDFSTMWRLFYDVEIFIAVYAVDTFGAKSFLGGSNAFHCR